LQHKGTLMSLDKYYQTRYRITIRDGKQPLLISQPTSLDRRRGMDTPKWLIPELCFLTGLTEEQRGNFKLMKVNNLLFYFELWFNLTSYIF
jgi:aubergine-like protein